MISLLHLNNNSLLILSNRLSQWFNTKESTCNAGDKGGVGFIPASGRSPRGGCGNSLQYFCVENPMDRGDWQSKVQGVTESYMVEVTSHECKA